MKNKKNNKLYISIVVCLVIGLVIGWSGGSIFPIASLQWIKNYADQIGKLSSSDKIQEVKNIMENDWYFSSEIDGLDSRLTDQALEGLTTNEEDTHTEYMSAEEVESFTKNINRNYVGIGVSYIKNGSVNMIETVYRNTPAEKAGLKTGDIILKVDGVDISDKKSSEIKEMISGEKGTSVTLTINRNGEYLTFNVIRDEVTATCYAEKLSDDVVYVHLYQFGDSSYDELTGYLSDLEVDSNDKLILDLRNNGGGYLTSLSKIASIFLPDDTLVMSQVYANGTSTEIRSSGGQVSNLHDIVILVNENTASAAEVLTLALKQNRDDVTIVGTTTYGKGTVQVTKYFDDGSALKYTTSKWLSPNGDWVNGVGITPDEEVKLHDVMYIEFVGMSDDKYEVDSVAGAIRDAQMCLSFLGYDVDRVDGYFSEKTKAVLTSFQSEHNLEANGVLNSDTYYSLRSQVAVEYNTNTACDTQLSRALEIVNGK